MQTSKAQSAFYQEGKRYVCRILPTTLSIDKPTGKLSGKPSGKSLVKPGGTYLITGGYGGLGLLFAEHLAKRSRATDPVKLILTGRSPLDAVKQSKIKTLEDLGSQVIYLQADVCDPIGMKAGLNQAKESFGSINGVIHAAGVAGKQNIFAKTVPDFQKVLEPKIKGTLVLDELLAAEPLDFVCYFSSSAAILGDFGSCDYAVANRFLMAHAHYRNQQRNQGKRQGKTIAINWPLWKGGGMGLGDDENTKMYLKSSGQRILEAGEGLEVFDRILAQNNAQQLVLAGQPGRVHRFLGLVKVEPAAAVAVISDPTNDASGKARGRRPELKGLNLEQCLEWDLKEQISRLLKISRDKLDRDENLADFGFDSISLAQLAKLLTNHYHVELTPALFFGYATIEKLTQYFLTEHQAAVEEFYREDQGVDECVAEVSSPTVPVERVVFNQRPKRSRFATGTRLQTGNITSNTLEPIAIIGMSGRFPGARNIEELWRILATGQDMVREIPAERFDWRQCYGDPAEPGKTNCKWCGCISGVSEFEPLFFEISPKEAETMDPRQRLLLQESWRALEDAGYGTKQIQTNKIGMFVGIEPGDYQLLTHGEGDVTSNSNAILASRLAYFLNLNGPVMAIDTACSSGLVAAHQAVLSLRSGECDTAIAAGVNLLLTPGPFIGMSQAGMLSEDGKCYAFDKRANGLVPGEAVAVLVFKRLSRAEADGDPIYAVIKGSGINYDGKTNGITAPSGVSQTALLKTVYDQYRVNPEEIELIITHGTGTKLGDPVEINALNDAFKGYTSLQGEPCHGTLRTGVSKQGYCALVSTKTNFGHTFAASGLVSLISLVQSFQHETIPASLHCERENDYINWKESPFYVNKANQPWPLNNGKTRTGAVSAFGMSGTNVHMVVQSYSGGIEPGGPEAANSDFQVQFPYYLLVFSAKTEESLFEKVKDLIELLQNKDINSPQLSEISYTLLGGRQHFSHRCAIVIRDREDAVYVLRQIGGEQPPHLFQGKVPRNFNGQKTIKQYVQDQLTRSRDLRENPAQYQEILLCLAELYCQGYEIDWQQLYGAIPIHRVHLPGYPFIKERYWFQETFRAPEIRSNGETWAGMGLIHPLIQQNTSDFTEQRFSSTFTGREDFLTDHVVKEGRVLTGMAGLEMARAAVAQMSGVATGDKTVTRLRNVWTQPIIVGDEPVRVHIGLYTDNYLEGNGEIAYEIYTIGATGANETERIVHGQGNAILLGVPAVPVLDLKAIRTQYTQSLLSIIKGTSHDAGQLGLEMLYVGDGGRLAQFSLKTAVSRAKDQFILNPDIMESALTAAGCFTGFDNFGQMAFTVEELDIYSKCTSPIWVLIEENRQNPAADKADPTVPTVKLNIDLCDDQGTVLVRIKGYAPAIMESEVKQANSAVTSGAMLLQACWKEQIVMMEPVAINYIQRLVVLCEMKGLGSHESVQENIAMQLNGVRCLILQSKLKGVDKRFQTYVAQIFGEIQNIFKDQLEGQVLFQIVVPNHGESQLHSGISGLLKTARLENPRFTGQLIEVDPNEALEGLVVKLEENARVDAGRYPDQIQIRYREGKRWIAGWSELTIAAANETIPWKEGGNYLITGGAGGLGLIFAKEIASKIKTGTLILTGRSIITGKKQAQIKELEAMGLRIIYQPVDITDKQAVDGLIQRITEEFGGLQGIIHAAGVIHDNYIMKKSQDELLEVLAPKVSGLVNLDLAGKELRLDFLVLFSSIAGSLGSPGQADYSAANSFMDAYARYRNQLVASKQRYGLTLAVNWPLWREGGMRVDAETEKLMTQTSGLTALKTEIGIRALYQGIASGQEQVMVLEGDLRPAAGNISR